MEPRLEFRVLGPLEVVRDGRPVDIGPPRQRALLADLLMHANEIVSTDTLLDDLWGENAPHSATNMIQVYVSRLRRALGRDQLLTQAHGYRLQVAEPQLDALRFASLLAEARRAMADGSPSAARELVAEAIGMSRGPPWADFTYEPFAQAEVTRLEELRLNAIELRAEADLALGRHVELVSELEQLVALHPFREPLRRQLMLALYRSDRQADALEAFRAARSVLLDELGIEPSLALRQLHQAILTQDRELDLATNQAPGGDRDTVVSALGNLPPELTSLLGREPDVERIAKQLARHRIVSLVGPGGVGKTRVAQRVARTVADRFQAGVWLVDLTPLGPAGDVAAAVASTVGIADRPGWAPLDALIGVLRERTLLLVLDSCEHVLGSAAEVASRLVSECPQVRVLATSRSPLAIAGEDVERLEPLGTTATDGETPPAVALFLERAASHGVAWEQPESALDSIRELCVRLDGLPLAIELASARTRAISPGELLSRLDDRLDLLVRPGQRAWPAHQRTLEATIAWSYELLFPDEQATLRRLSIFHAGFSLQAAAAVCADIATDLETLDHITALVDRSVAELGRSRDRYRLLDSIAMFAERRLREAGEHDGARDRHARFFHKLAADTDDPSGDARLDIEQDNITAALEWFLEGDGDPSLGAQLAVSLGLRWNSRGRSNAARHWFQLAIEHGDRIDRSTRVDVHVAYAVLAYSAGEMDTALAQARLAVDTGRTARDPELLVEPLAQLAAASQHTGDDSAAAAAAAELRALQPQLRSPRARAMALFGTGVSALGTGDAHQARLDMSAARETARRAGDHLHAAMCGFWLAYALALDQAMPSARRTIREAMHDAAASGYEMLVADNLAGQASLAFADDDLDTAGQLLPRAIEMLREQQRWVDVGGQLRTAAAVALERGDPERSAMLLGQSRRWTDQLDFQDQLLLPRVARLPERIIDRLGAEATEHACARGSAMSLDAAAALLATPAPTGDQRVDRLASLSDSHTIPGDQQLRV